MEELVKYKWLDHGQNIISQFSNFWKQEMFTDCTLFCGGKKFPVHRLVLASCSEYFKEVFNNVQCCHPIIIMNDISSENLQILLNYIYQVDLIIPQRKLLVIIEEGRGLKIRGLEALNQFVSNSSSNAKYDIAENIRLLQKCLSPVVSLTKLSDSHGNFSLKRMVPKEWDSEIKVRKINDSGCDAKVKVIKNLVEEEASPLSFSFETSDLENIFETSNEYELDFLGFDNAHRKQDEGGSNEEQMNVESIYDDVKPDSSIFPDSISFHVLNQRQDEDLIDEEIVKEEEEVLSFPLEKSLPHDSFPTNSQSSSVLDLTSSGLVLNQRRDEELFNKEIVKEGEENLSFPLEKSLPHDSFPTNSQSSLVLDLTSSGLEHSPSSEATKQIEGEIEGNRLTAGGLFSVLDGSLQLNPEESEIIYTVCDSTPTMFQRANESSHFNELLCEDFDQSRDRHLNEKIDYVKEKENGVDWKKKRPRPCKFCGKHRTNMGRHLLTVHKMEKDVKDALQLSRCDRNKLLKSIRLAGIHKYNSKMLSKLLKSIRLAGIHKYNSKMLSEHKYRKIERQRCDVRGKIGICPYCKAFISKRSGKEHMKRCFMRKRAGDKPEEKLTTVPTKNTPFMSKLFSDILDGLRDDPTGITAKESVIVCLLGRNLCRERIRNNTLYHIIKKNILSEMRLLTRLIKIFIVVGCEKKLNLTEFDLFEVKYWDFFVEALKRLCGQEDNAKHGIKLILRNILTKTLAAIRSEGTLRCSKDDDDKDSEDFLFEKLSNNCTEFSVVLTRSQKSLFRVSSEVLKRERRQKIKTKPVGDMHTSVKIVNKYIDDEVEKIIGEIKSKKLEVNVRKYIFIRQLVVCKLNLFNASRGGEEPCRITISEYKDGLTCKIPDYVLKKYENDEVLENYILIYMIGKGNQYVDILVPKALAPLLSILSDEEIRFQVQVSQSNPFLFPSTGFTESFASGYHDLLALFERCQISMKFSVDDLRLRASTCFWELEMSQYQRKLFFEHIGHSEKIDSSIYRDQRSNEKIVSHGNFGNQEKVHELDPEDHDNPVPEPAPVNSNSVAMSSPAWTEGDPILEEVGEEINGEEVPVKRDPEDHDNPVPEPAPVNSNSVAMSSPAWTEGDPILEEVGEEINGEEVPVKRDPEDHDNPVPEPAPVNSNSVAMSSPAWTEGDPILEEVGEEINGEEVPVKRGRSAFSLKRPCHYCFQVKKIPYEFVKLTKHFKAAHKREEEVSQALQYSNKKARRRAFELLRKKGIKMVNIELYSKFGEDAILQRERRNSNRDLKMCLRCSGFFSKKTISVHMKNCLVDDLSTNAKFNGNSVSPSLILNTKSPDQFDIDVIGTLNLDEIGNFIRDNDILKSIGRCMYYSKYSKSHKEKGNASNVRQSLRIISNLFTKFRALLAEKVKVSPTTITIEEMFQRQTRFVEGVPSVNLKVLEKVVQDVSSDGSNTRAKIYWTLMKAVTILNGIYSTNCQDDLAKELQYFKNALKCNGSTAGIFSDSIHAPHYVREFKLRKPEHLPNSEDVKKVRDFVVGEIQRICDPYLLDKKSLNFVYLRQLLITRLTFLNGRRGGEASRLTIEQYKTAKNSEWINKEFKQLIKNSEEINLLEKFKLAYLCGKGRSIVPLLIPHDCLLGMDMLSDFECRCLAGVNMDNIFMFPATRDRKYNVSGTSDISFIIRRVELGKPITATQMRHFISTQYSYNNTSKDDLYYFSLHFGHDREINQKIYQCPLSIQEIIRVGGILDTIDDKLGNKRAQVTNDENADPRTLEPETVLSQPCSSYQELESRGTISHESTQSIPEDPHSSERLNINSEDIELVEPMSEEELSSEEVSVVPKKRKKDVPRAKWTPEETQVVQSYFKDFIQDFSDITGCKGRNPPKGKVEKFINDYPTIMNEFTPRTKRAKIKQKCFNIRKTLRFNKLKDERKLNLKFRV